MDFIRTYRQRFGVESICAVLTEHGITIAPSTFYAHQSRGFGPTDAELDDAYTADRLHDLWRDNRCVYGRHKLWKAAHRNGLDVGRDQVQRLMKVTGIRGVSRGMHKRRTTISDPSRIRHPDLVKRRWDHPSRPDQWWIADFTYVWTARDGFCYTAFIVDAYSRMILGWVTTTVMDTRMVLMALEHALFSRKRTKMEFTSTGLVHHSDAGVQYTSLAFTETLTESGIDGSIGTVGDALDNAMMESTIGLYKTELIDFDPSRTWQDASEVERETASYVYWYNYQRLHSSIADVPPVEYEQAYESQHQSVKAQ
ncbi:MAG: IS3 family transposase [Corynebacterium casei]|uniref:Transposase n=2 Tax=Corynebacterium casei TaxID=160386 RepID=G7I239_9CORY|nr:IS3 family transposase [Corynebacterium casei]AHI18690.1 Integrase catalytic region [Corynebacterium casei LMG S-19264]CCE56504.1 transposase [Corynebacterium casei UCMA 3821]